MSTKYFVKNCCSSVPKSTSKKYQFLMQHHILTDLNAITRAMDLLCKILSPVTAGLVMTAASLTTAAIFIAAWNFCSVFVEYGLLLQVYRLVPQLAVKEDDVDTGECTDRLAVFNGNLPFMLIICFKVCLSSFNLWIMYV